MTNLALVSMEIFQPGLFSSVLSFIVIVFDPKANLRLNNLIRIPFMTAWKVDNNK